VERVQQMTSSDEGASMAAEPVARAGRRAPDFDRLFAEEYRGMVALAAAVSGDRSMAEDLVQEAFSRLSQRWDRIGSYDKPGAWLRRVVINLAVSRRRRLVSEARARLRLRQRPRPALPPPPSDHSGLWAAVAELPAKQRAVVALHYLDDLPLTEIADILDISPSTARVHLHRARTTLRDRLDPEDAR
jgi:RNA polymerase sigma-70 factor (ECF subfamily)